MKTSRILQDQSAPKVSRKQQLDAELTRQQAMVCVLVGTPSQEALEKFWTIVINGNLKAKAHRSDQ